MQYSVMKYSAHRAINLISKIWGKGWKKIELKECVDRMDYKSRFTADQALGRVCSYAPVHSHSPASSHGPVYP